MASTLLGRALMHPLAASVTERQIYGVLVAEGHFVARSHEELEILEPLEEDGYVLLDEENRFVPTPAGRLYFELAEHRLRVLGRRSGWPRG